MSFELVFLVSNDHGAPPVWNSPYCTIRIYFSIMVPAQMNLIDYNENAKYIEEHFYSQFINVMLQKSLMRSEILCSDW